MVSGTNLARAAGISKGIMVLSDPPVLLPRGQEREGVEILRKGRAVSGRKILGK